MNLILSSADPANLTIAGVQVNSLICPSDIQNQIVPMPAQRASATNVIPGWSWNEIYPLPPGNWTQAFTSYAGNAGTFTFGFSNLTPTTVLGFFNGVIYNDSSVQIASITDGMSNTFAFAERSLSGCGGLPSASATGPPPPHGGMIAVRGANLFVEVVKKEPGPSKSPMTAEVSFYLLDNASTPYSPAPTSGMLVLGKKKVTLKVQDGGLTTPDGPPLFPKGGVDGTLSAELDGKTIDIPLGVR